MPIYDDTTMDEFRTMYAAEGYDPKEMSFNTWFNTNMCLFIGNHPDVDLNLYPLSFVLWMRSVHASGGVGTATQQAEKRHLH